MRNYVLKRTHTRSTTRRNQILIGVLASAVLTSTLAVSAILIGPKQDCALSVYQQLQSTAESPVAVDLNLEAEAEAEAEVEEEEFAVPSNEVELVAKTLYGEARGCSSEEQALVAWCICNRADVFGKSIEEVVTQPYQFHGYADSNPVWLELEEVATEVLEAWYAGEEALVVEPYATTSEYLFFYGDGQHNWFREEY